MHLARPLLSTSALRPARGEGNRRAFLLLHAQSLGRQSYKPSVTGLALIQRNYSAQLKTNRPKDDADSILDDVELGARDWHYHHRLEGGHKSKAPVRELNRILKQDERLIQQKHQLDQHRTLTANQTFSQHSHGFHTSASQGFGHRSQSSRVDRPDTHGRLQEDGNDNFSLPHREPLKKATDSLREGAHKAHEKVNETTEEGVNKAAQFKDRVQEKVNEAAEGGAHKAANLKDKLSSLNSQLADAYAAAKDNLIGDYEDAKGALDKEAERLKKQGSKPGQHTSPGVLLDTNDTYDIAKDNVVDPEQANQKSEPSSSAQQKH
ncbi:hypothetical protein IWQ61_000171 [Dispira simplex]|nr:hypothetical protein IWQ61_000171 [Dispira simplex]